jgi:hypothetical protein
MCVPALQEFPVHPWEDTDWSKGEMKQEKRVGERAKAEVENGNGCLGNMRNR